LELLHSEVRAADDFCVLCRFTLFLCLSLNIAFL
jgi:hypothetical protein